MFILTLIQTTYHHIHMVATFFPNMGSHFRYSGSNEVWRKVMFSQASVCSQGMGCDIEGGRGIGGMW